MIRAARAMSGVVVTSCASGILALVIGGCSGGGGGGGGAGTTSTTATATPTATAPSATSASVTPSVTLTGPPLDAQALNALLLPRGDMPKGYLVDSSTTRYDGQVLPTDTPSPIPSSALCGILAQTASIRAAGINAADFAQATYANPSRTAEIAEIAEEIDAFQGADAQKSMTALWHAFGQCTTFDQPFAGGTARTTLSRSVLGGQWPGIKAIEVSPAFEGGQTLVFVRVDYAIVTVMDSSTGSDNGSAAISMAERIASRLAAAERG